MANESSQTADAFHGLVIAAVDSKDKLQEFAAAYKGWSDAADAARFRWLCDGNGYFLEEQGIAGHGNELERARRAIDERMRAAGAPASTDTKSD